ncbi:MAG: hypothetical protein B6I24_10225 [Bacteroidetes bacterium 4572_128]|nr:MAG: hypothetical protein B6I24_10225 [Bacteroidetes bacterium 4572_128]
MNLTRIIISVILPPLAVYDKGCGSILIVAVLSFFFWVPGIISALVILSLDDKKKQNLENQNNFVRGNMNYQNSHGNQFQHNNRSYGYGNMNLEQRVLQIASENEPMTLREIVMKTGSSIDEVEIIMKKLVNKLIAKKVIKMNGEIMYDFYSNIQRRTITDIQVETLLNISNKLTIKELAIKTNTNVSVAKEKLSEMYLNGKLEMREENGEIFYFVN